MTLVPCSIRVDEYDLEKIEEAARSYYPRGDTGNRSRMIRDILHGWVQQTFYTPREQLVQLEGGSLILRVRLRGFEIMSIEAVNE